MRLVGRTSTRRAASLRHRRAPRPGGRWAAATLVIAIVSATAAYVGFDSWKKWHAPVPASSDLTVDPVAATPSRRSAQGKVTPAAVASGTNATQVTKCVVNGVVSYSDSNCPADARASTLAVDPGENLATGLPADVRRQVLGGPAQAPRLPRSP